MPGSSHRKCKLYLLLLALLGAGAGLGAWELLFRTRYNFPRREADFYINDPLLGHRHRPHARREFQFPEHPRGRIEMRTNNLGLRMDRDVTVSKPAGTKRVLVVGDSHFDGVVYNDESFACILERLLNDGPQSPCVEVLNASTGYYGPDQYLKSLDAYRDLEADHWVVGFYSGNDFLDAVRILEASGSGPRSRPWGYKLKLRRADRRHAGAVAQLLNQAYYLRTFPDMRGMALDRVESLFREMHRKALEHRASLSVVLIPTIWDVGRETLGSDFREAAAALGLGDADMRIVPEMRLDLQRRLAGAGVSCLDPAGEMMRRRSSYFWDMDFHLNVTGHALLAELAAPGIRRQLTE